MDLINRRTLIKNIMALEQEGKLTPDKIIQAIEAQPRIKNNKRKDIDLIAIR